MVFPPGDNNPLDLYPIKHPLDGTEMLEICNEGTKKLYGVVDDIVTLATLASGNKISVDAGVGVAALTIPLDVNVIQTTGYYVAADGGGALYKRVATQPVHAGKWQSADGAWWEYVPDVGEVNLLAFGADPTGVTSISTAFANAITFATIPNPPRGIYVPRGAYRVATQILLPDRMSVRGDGSNQTVFVPTMTDGTACLKVVSSGNFVTLRDFRIDTGINQDVFRAGTLAPNCIGIDMSDISVGAISRWYIENVTVYGVALGATMNGWIGTAVNFWFSACELGFKGSRLNGCWLNLHIEVCRKSFELHDGYATTLACLQDEGDCLNKVASTVDYCTSLTFENPYWEAGSQYPQTQPYVVFGPVTFCRNLIITGAFLETNLLPVTVPALDFIASFGIRIDSYVGDGELGVGPLGMAWRFSGNCYDIEQRMSSRTVIGHYQDATSSNDTMFNLAPNAYFDTWLRGWDTIANHNTTFTRDIYTTRRGRNSVKIMATAGTNNNYLAFHLTDARLLQQVYAEKTFRVGAWIYIPAITEYSPASHTALPDISMYVTDGSATYESVSRAPQTLVTGAWNFIYSDPCTPQTLVTDVQVRLWANRTSTNATGNEFIFVDSISLVDVHVSMEDQRRGNFIPDSSCPVFTNGLMIATRTALPTDVNQSYERGDQILRYNVGTGESPGWTCIGGTAGGDPTAWEPMPPLEQHVTYLTLPSVTAANAGRRIFCTNACNAGETPGTLAGTGCWCYVTSAGLWFADWSGLAVTA